MEFANRSEAGKQLSRVLSRFRGEDVVVLGLPRGGVPVAFEVARALGAPLDVIVVRKLGVPFQPELGMGAIGEDGVRVINDEVVRLAGVSDEEIARTETRERAEVARRAERFRAGARRLDLRGQTALIVDDGIATGSTARAACRVARAHGAARVVLAAPVASPRTIDELRSDADEVVCLQTPEWFFGIGQFYADFTQVPDAEVADLLDRARSGALSPDAGPTSPNRPPGDPPYPGRLPFDAEVTVMAGRVALPGRLVVPESALGVVLFAHGSGSSRHSPRNRFVADLLHAAGVGTLLFDLLTASEESDRANVFDIGLLAGRLGGATDWLRAQPAAQGLAVGYFGASTGAGAALWAAAAPGAAIAAIVSRGGRPDLAGSRLSEVRAPTLLIVGGADDVVLDLNRDAQSHLRCQARLAVVPGATHLFEEPGTLRTAAELARDWFVAHLPEGAPAHGRRPLDQGSENGEDGPGTSGGVT